MTLPTYGSVLQFLSNSGRTSHHFPFPDPKPSSAPFKLFDYLLHFVPAVHQKIMSSIEEFKNLQIPLQHILSATNDFAQENYIGTGASGKVYRGVSERYGIIAIKRWDNHLGTHSHGDREFKMEIALLSIYKHENIVYFHGFCDEEGEKILVYKYESNGSLDKHLKSRDLTWTQRLQICLDVAHGLKYLHYDVVPEHRTIHRVVKSANILLDENRRAKISDFGLSRKRPAQSSFVVSNACGSPGYIDPEYLLTGHLTPKSDVFSFGLVLFEVLSGRLAFIMVDSLYFNVWIQKHCNRRTVDKIILSDLHEQINPTSLHTFSTIAYKCLNIGEERPTMKEVVEKLQKALDNQLAPSGPRSNVYNDEDYAALNQRNWRETASFSQPSPATSQPRKYDVYLSFRGEDTRYTFADHLYSALVKQLEIAKDDEILMRGEPIGPSLLNAINESKIAIIIFSQNYAASTWCLDELAYIMECRNERGLIVLPVFYHVDPSHVRRQNGSYAEAFSRHNSINIEKVEHWRNAMVHATDLAGFVVTGHEAQAVENIVYTVTHRLLNLMPHDEAIAKRRARANLVGIETRVQDLRLLLKLRSGGVRMVGICGIWGSGKSTLASSVYDEIRHEFDGCCIIKNVRAESRMHGLKTLQEKILSDVFKSEVTLDSIEQGINMMKERLCQNKVLIVLDDVDHFDHLKFLAGSPDWFGEGSRIVITSRNQDLVKAHNCITHNVWMLDVDEAIELFSLHAFGAGRPVEGCEGLSRSMVSKLGGHPLALKSLGYFLHDKDLIEWVSTLDKLEDIRMDEILEKFNGGDDGLSRDTFSWLAT